MSEGFIDFLFTQTYLLWRQVHTRSVKLSIQSNSVLRKWIVWSLYDWNIRLWYWSLWRLNIPYFFELLIFKWFKLVRFKFLINFRFFLFCHFIKIVHLIFWVRLRNFISCFALVVLHTTLGFLKFVDICCLYKWSGLWFLIIDTLVIKLWSRLCIHFYWLMDLAGPVGVHLWWLIVCLLIWVLVDIGGIHVQGWHSSILKKHLFLFSLFLFGTSISYWPG